MNMKALSIQQPWAYLIVNGLKDIENRNWSTSYRGFILIHAGKKIDTTVLHPRGYLNRYYDFAPKWQEVGAKMPAESKDYETGGIVGYATLTSVVTNHTSPWFVGPYGFMLTDRHPLPFLPLRGSLHLFDVPKDIEEQVLSLIAERKERKEGGQIHG